jgi:hypothetical protein
MRHTGVVLPQKLLERLKTDGANSRRGLSGEIRHRLQGAYDQEARDPETRFLIECADDLANSISADLGVAWYLTAFGRAAMKAGLLVFIGKYDGKGEKVPDVSWSGYPDDAPPEVVGQTHARLVLKARQRDESE